MQRNAAINNLRGFGTFRYASLRLLDDLIEVMGPDRLAPRQIDSYVDCAKKASFSLYWSLDLRYWDKKYRDNEPRYHSICLCSANGHGLQLEPLGHLLAYSIAQQFDEPAAVVSLGERQVHFWHRGGFVGPLPLPAKTDDHSIGTELKTLLPEPHPPFYHLIYVHPRASEAASKAQRFHRIVYINPEPDIAAVPSHLRGLLIEPVWDGD